MDFKSNSKPALTRQVRFDSATAPVILPRFSVIVRLALFIEEEKSYRLREDGEQREL